MKFRKCVALLAATLVGFGVVATDAATVSSITITSPSDSGALRGIDSTFTVQAKLLDFTPADSLEVIFYLVTTNDSTGIGKTLRLFVRGGPSRGVVALFIEAIDGIPTVRLIEVDQLGRLGNWRVTRTVPAGLSGIEITVRAFACSDPSGQRGVLDTETVTLRFE